MPMHLKAILLSTGLITFGFGLWHVFVPDIWQWYDHIEPRELVLAVKATNLFFSISLMWLGGLNMLSVKAMNPFSVVAILSATTSIWLVRVVFQLVTPQGTEIPWIQYSMLISFLLVFGLQSYALFTIVKKPYRF